MMTQSAMPAVPSFPPPVAAADWSMIVAQRIGAPPLRFKGRQVFHRTIDTLFITLWERKTGGFTLCYSDFQNHIVQPNALVVADIEAAAAHLEARCPNDWGSAAIVVSSRLRFDDLQRALHYRHHFPFLVGDTLALWDSQIMQALS